MFEIGDKVKAYDGQIGTIIDTKMIALSGKLPNFQHIFVKFPDRSTMDGLSEDFQAVLEKPIAKARAKLTPRFEPPMTNKR